MNESNKYQCDTTCVSLQIVTKRTIQTFAVCVCVCAVLKVKVQQHTHDSKSWLGWVGLGCVLNKTIIASALICYSYLMSLLSLVGMFIIVQLMNNQRADYII